MSSRIYYSEKRGGDRPGDEQGQTGHDRTTTGKRVCNYSIYTASNFFQKWGKIDSLSN